jgi:predicted ester cyclase
VSTASLIPPSRSTTSAITRARCTARDSSHSARSPAIGEATLSTHGDHPGSDGVEAFKYWLRWYHARFTDPAWTIHDVVAAGDKMVARYSEATTYRGSLLDIPSKNQRVVEIGIRHLQDRGRQNEGVVV